MSVASSLHLKFIFIFFIRSVLSFGNLGFNFEKKALGLYLNRVYFQEREVYFEFNYPVS